VIHTKSVRQSRGQPWPGWSEGIAAPGAHLGWALLVAVAAPGQCV